MKKVISVLLVLSLVFSFAPPLSLSAHAAGTDGTDASEMNALAALGIDTNAAPEGYSQGSSNPYGKDSITINPVRELLVTAFNSRGVPKIFTTDDGLKGKTTPSSGQTQLKSTLYGDGVFDSVADLFKTSTEKTHGSADFSDSKTYSPAGNLTTASQSTGDYAVTVTAAGNFTGKVKDDGSGGKQAQAVMVYAGALAANGGLYMKFGDADGTFGTAKTLLDTTQRIGNLDSNIEEDFADLPHLMQNYLQVATGDFDGNGVDEIAVYIPQQGNSRIAVFRLKQTADTDYTNPEHWEIAWNYYLNERPYVSNMVSLTAGDFNRDGVDDLAATYGYYYGPDKRSGGTAVVMYGSSSRMLQSSASFPLSYEGSPIVRSAFTYGDITGGGDSLILGGQLDSDIAAGNLYSRFVAVYTYEDGAFQQTLAKNFDLFEKNSDGGYTYTVMSGRGDRFYSSPLCVANLTTLSRGLSQSAQLYFDSLLLTYGDQGLELAAPLDMTDNFQGAVNGLLNDAKREYVEYGADSADLVGKGFHTAATMQYFLPYSLDWLTGSGLPDSMEWVFGDLIAKIKDLYGDFYYPGETYLNVFGNESGAGALQSYKHQLMDFSASFCLPDTDVDTSLLKYTGKHYFTYTAPEVLAVLASPPFFADLLRDDLSGSYGESSTSYSSSSGSGGGVTANATIKAGAYISFEQSISVFGVEVAKVEAEASITAAFTYEFEKISMLEQEITYSAVAGEDMVAFYSIPLEIYEYTAYTPDGNGGYQEQLMTVSVPRTAAVQVLPLTTYEAIAADYDELPQISGSILTHTVGDPSTYPTATSGYKKAIAYTGDYSGVSFSASGGAISQTITMTEETTNSYSGSLAIEGKVGAGAGGVTVGVIAGVEGGAGRVDVSTVGSSFSGEMYNMPVEAQPYGYGLNWKIFSYEHSYNDGSTVKSFPIVNYLVKDVSAPSALPADFAQNAAGTEADKISLTWSYDRAIAGFQLYRYYEFPDGSGSYPLTFIPFDQGNYNAADKLYYFEFIDENLDAYTDYDYQIQAVRAYVPNSSITSEVLTARTKAAEGYPVSTLSRQVLPIYPDSVASESSVKVTVTNAADYPGGVNYQWQKLVKGAWQNLSGKTTDTLTFSAPGLADEAEYRCRLNVIYQGQYISAYSDSFQTVYAKRVPKLTDAGLSVSAGSNGIPAAAITLESADASHNAAPTGEVTFTISGTDYQKSYTTALEPNGRTATASIPENATALPDGVYEITASYSGSRVFKSLTTEPKTLLVGDAGYQLALKNVANQAATAFTYGEKITPALSHLTPGTGGGADSADETGTATYTLRQWQTVKKEGKIWILTYTYYVRELTDMEGAANLSSTDLASKLKTLPVGDYAVEAYGEDDGDGKPLLASREFAIKQRAITVSVKEPFSAAKGEVSGKLPGLAVTEGSLANGESLDESLGLYVRATNTASNEITLDNSTEPANYSITGALKPDATGEQKAAYANYAIAFVSGTYTVTGAQYAVTAECELVNGNVAGTVAILEPESHNGDWGKTYSGGTALYFRATPKTGYEVESWTVNGDLDAKAGKAEYLSYTMEDEPLHIIVSFKPVDTRLTTIVTPENAGKITSSDPYFTSGGIVSTGAEMDFTAEENEGYHFVRWEVVRGGLTTGSENPILNFVMSKAVTQIYAVFARDNYTLTLGENLRAWYEHTYVEGGQTQTEKKYVTSGASIPGDKEVTVEPAPGYAIADDAVWYSGEAGLTEADGVAADKGSYTFTITGDTSVTVETANERYTLSISVSGAAGGTAEVAIAGGDAEAVTDSQNFESIAGGSQIVLTAKPAYGYVFEKWTVNGADHIGSTLNIAALGAETAVVAHFKANASYTVSVTHGARGTMTYTLKDGKGNPVEEDEALPQDGKITVFKGDKLTLKAAPDTSFMVDKWTVNQTVIESSAKTYELDYAALSADAAVHVEFKAQSYYTVTYKVNEDDESKGKITSATFDGQGFISGYAYVGGGTTVVVNSKPETDYTVDKWTLNGAPILNEHGAPFNGDVLTIEALRAPSSTAEILVYFKGIVTHTITLPGSDINVSVTWEAVPDRSSLTGDNEVFDGDSAVFTIKAEEGYRLDAVGVTGNTGEDGLNGFDSITEQEDGSLVCVVSAVTNGLTVTAAAKKLHEISVVSPAPVGGSILLGAEKAVAGDTVTLSATLNSGHSFGGWTLSPTDDAKTGEILIADKNKPSTSFTMPDFDVKVSAAFTPIPPAPPVPPAPGSGDDESQILPKDIVESGEKASVTMTEKKKTISDAANEELIERNRTMDILITGNGLRILIPAGSLAKGDDLNLMLLNMDGLTGASGWVLVRYHSDGSRVIVPWFLLENGLASFIAKDGGTYKLIRNPVSFGDTAGHWAEEDIGFVASRELFMGTGEDRFSADSNMSRAMLVTVLHRLDDLLSAQGEGYGDVPAGQWYSDAISWASVNGIVSGYGNGNFGTNDDITREQLAVFLYRFAKYLKMDVSAAGSLDGFADRDKVSGYADDALRWATETGLINGRSETVLAPDGKATRAEVATILKRFITLATEANFAE